MPEDEQVRRGLAGRSDFTATPSKDIRIEQVRRLQERLSLRPLEAPHKLVLIIAAQQMTPQAQNALLKTLEEPPKDTVLVLVSSAQDKLLPTIRSRCTRATFAPLPEDFIAQKLKVLKKLDDEPARVVASMAGGSLARALELDPKRLAERKDLIERFEALQPGDARGWLQLAEVMGEDRQTAEAALDVLQVWTRDVARAQVGGGALVNGELSALAVAAATRVSPGGLQRRVVLLDEAKNAITQRNGAARLQVERMLIEMFGA
jgi:DNA polymerase-3 subunit delta'